LDAPGIIAELISNGVTVEFIVIFSDPALESTIRLALDKPIGDIYANELLEIITLITMQPEINDLSGLEYCQNLQYLTLIGHPIGDITLISRLTNLQNLDLRACQIVDITPLSGLTNLRHLNLYANQIVDISPLLECLDSGDTVDVAENPLNSEAPAIISTLETMGVVVYS